MPVLPTGAVVPSGSEQFAYEKQMATLGLTAGGVVVVADAAEMESVVAQMRASGYPPTAEQARQFYLGDIGALVIHDGNTAQVVRPPIERVTPITVETPGKDNFAFNGTSESHPRAYSQGGRVHLVGYANLKQAESGWITGRLKLPQWAWPKYTLRFPVVAAGQMGMFLTFADGGLKLYLYGQGKTSESIPLDSINWNLDLPE